MGKRRASWRRRRATLTGVGVAVVATILALLVATVASPPRTAAADAEAAADYEGLYVVCPAPVPEGDTDDMEVKWPGYRGIGVTVFTYQGSYTADGSDFTSYNGVKMKGDSDSDTLYVPVITTDDTRPEHDETFSIGFWASGTWYGCVVTIEDDDAPRITGVAIDSRPAAGTVYRAGETIEVAVTLDKKVDVQGDVLLGLDLDGGGLVTWRGAPYDEGSGTSRLTFSYEVKRTDRDRDGVSVGAPTYGVGPPMLGFTGRGMIVATGTDVPIEYAHTGLDDSADHKVDGRPYVQSAGITSTPPGGGDSYRANQAIELTMRFDTEVEVEGDVHADLYLGLDGDNQAEARRPAAYRSGSSTDTLVFSYTVKPGDMAPEGIAIAEGRPGAGLGGSGTIRAVGTSVGPNPNYAGSGHLPGHRVDTAPPTISSIAIESRPGNGEAYRAGEAVTVAVTFSETVTATGNLTLQLDIGGTERTAVFVAGQQAGASVLFNYQVQEGDADADGISISANSLRLHEGAILDAAGNAAGLSHAGVPPSPSQQVDTSAGN